jgi:Transcriptional activator TraM
LSRDHPRKKPYWQWESGGMNNGIEAFRLQLQKELGLSIGPKDPLLALWVSQKELLEQNAAQQQKLLSEFQLALGRNQTAWSEKAKALAQQSLNGELQAAQNSTVLLLEEAARMNGAAVRKAFEEGVARMEHALATGRRIAWLSLVASAVALTAAVCARASFFLGRPNTCVTSRQIGHKKANRQFMSRSA